MRSHQKQHYRQNDGTVSVLQIYSFMQQHNTYNICSLLPALEVILIHGKIFSSPS